MLAHAQVGEDLRADAVVAQVGGEAELQVRLDGVEPAVLQRVGAQLVREPDAAALLAQVEQHARAALGDRAQRRVQLRAAVAALRAEHVAGEALRVHAHQRRLAAAHVALAPARRGGRPRARSRTGAAGTCPRRSAAARVSSAPHQLLAAAAVLDQVADGEDAEPVLRARTPCSSGRRIMRPSSVRISHSAPTGPQPREPAQVGHRLGVAGAAQHAARHRAQREHVPGPHEVRRASRADAPARAACARGRTPTCRWWCRAARPPTR